jgi:hypothetical protein
MLSFCSWLLLLLLLLPLQASGRCWPSRPFWPAPSTGWCSADSTIFPLLTAAAAVAAGIRAMLAKPTFQAGAKYWLVLSLMLCATLASLHFDPALVSLNPAFGFVAASLAMSERVEATVSKVSSRV